MLFRLLGFALILIFSSVSSALCVRTEPANLRSGPGGSFKKTWTVGKYTPLVEVGRKGSWLKVKDQEGITHWIFSSLVSRSAIRCMAVKKAKANVRKAPSARAALATAEVVDLYTPLKRLDSSGDWYYVESRFGEKFWIHRSNVWRPLKVSRINY